MKLRSLLMAGTAVAAFLGPVTTAPADALDQTVTGTAGTSIALSVPTAAALTLTPGSTATSTGGTITAVDTNPSWTLTAKDGASTGANGKMDAASTGCVGSVTELASALSLTVAPAVANGSITSTARSLTSSNQTVAAATAVPLAATVFNTTFSQAVGAGETLTAGCVYTLTTTYTLT